MYKFKENKRIFQSKFLALSLIFSFILLIATEASPRNINHNSDKEFKPVVKVRQNQEDISESQKKLFKTLIDDGKKLLQEEMDYEGAINKFKKAQGLAATREQRADALFYLSLAHYATLAEKGDKEFNETIRKLLEINYYRKLDELLCPPRYVQLFRGIKEEYGVLRIQSKPAGADVYINESKDSAGKTPVTIGTRAGTIRIRIKKGKQEKRDTLQITAGKETASPTYILKGRSSLIYVIGGIVLAGGVGAALLSGGKGNGGGTPAPSPGPTTGSIQVNSNPTGAAIFLDGTDTGQTTNSILTNVTPGNHTVRLTKEGYIDYEESVSVTAGQTATVSATLTQRPVTGGYEFITKWGSEGSDDGQFNHPNWIAVDSSGYVYVADTYNHRIQKFTSDGTFITKWGSSGDGDGQFNQPQGIAVDSSEYVYVVDYKNVQKFTSNGTFVTKWGSEGSGDGQFNEPLGIAVDNSGYVYVADRLNHRIQKFTSGGSFVTKWGSEGSGDGQFNEPHGIVADESGYVYVTDKLNRRIQKFTSSGSFVTKWGSYGNGDGQFNSAWGIATDSAAYVYVVDAAICRIQKFTSNGTFIAKWGSSGDGDGQFFGPIGIAVDGAGYVYVVEWENTRVQKFGPASAIQKVAKLTYSLLNNHSINRNLRPRPSLLNHPARDRLKKKQDLMNKKVRRGKGKDGK